VTFKIFKGVNNKHVPDLYKYNSRENQLKLLAGILDTDGSYHDCTYDIIQKNLRLAQDIQYIVRSLGLSSTIVSCVKSCMYLGKKCEGTYYRQQIYGNGIHEIPCLIKRKQATARTQIKNNLYCSIKVEEYYETNPESKHCYEFTIDENQRFLLADFTVL